MTELKPCPFCGNEYVILDTDYDEKGAYVFCPSCGIYVTGETYRESLIEKLWNRRADDG